MEYKVKENFIAVTKHELVQENEFGMAMIGTDTNKYGDSNICFARVEKDSFDVKEGDILIVDLTGHGSVNIAGKNIYFIRPEDIRAYAE